MGLIRLLFLLLILWVIWFMVRNFRLKQERRQQHKLDAGRIVKCRYCEVHLPQQQALGHDDDWFCNQAHRQAWLADSNKS